jgi:Tol biopolymer transport system component
MRSWTTFVSTALLTVAGCAAQTRTPVHLLDWVEARDDASYLDKLRSRLDRLTDFFVRVTSPDIPRESKHLWIVSADGKNKCLVSSESGVSEPRWGGGGYILYLVEADTNGDGAIDFRDEYLVRTVQPAGREARTLGQGQSAVWAPDGRHAAIIHDANILVASLDGQTAPLGPAGPAGKLVVTNTRASSRTRQFWTVDARTSASQELPDTLRAKYLWLGALSGSGTKLVFADAMKTDIFIRSVAGGEPDRNVTNDRFLDMDPSWSPDEKHIVYVSDNPLRSPLCSAVAW